MASPDDRQSYEPLRVTAHLLPAWCVDGLVVESVWELCQEEAYTRRDDEKNEKLRRLIAPETRALLEDKAAAARDKRGTDQDVRDAKADPKQQMRYYVETLAAGTRFFWDITLDDASELEFEAFCVALAEFGRMPFIGGKSGVGHGKVAVHFDKWLEVEPRLAPAGQEIAAPLGSLYRAHLAERGAEIRSLLDGLA